MYKRQHFLFISSGLVANARGDLKEFTRLSVTLQELAPGAIQFFGFADGRVSREDFPSYVAKINDNLDPRPLFSDAPKQKAVVPFEAQIKSTRRSVNFYQIGMANGRVKDHDFTGTVTVGGTTGVTMSQLMPLKLFHPRTTTPFIDFVVVGVTITSIICLLYTSPSPRD